MLSSLYWRKKLKRNKEEEKNNKGKLNVHSLLFYFFLFLYNFWKQETTRYILMYLRNKG